MYKIGDKLKLSDNVKQFGNFTANIDYEIASQRLQDRKFVIFDNKNNPEYFDEKDLEFYFILIEEIKTHRNHNVGSSNYSKLTIQPWDVWKAWNLNPWDADMVKRIGRTKHIPNMTIQEARIEDYEKIIHNCEERIHQLKEEINDTISKN